MQVHRDICGTTRGYRQHLKHGEEPCRRCRDANAAYSREQRRTSEAAQLAARRTAARGRALTRLGQRYPNELEALLTDELQQAYLLDYVRGNLK